MAITPDKATISPTIDHFICALAVSTLFGSPKESIYCKPAITNEITVTTPNTVNIQLRKVANTHNTGPEKQMAGNENTLPNLVDALPVEKPKPVGIQVPPSRVVPAGQDTGPLPEPLPLPAPTPVKGGPPEPLPDPEPKPLPEPELPLELRCRRHDHVQRHQARDDRGGQLHVHRGPGDRGGELRQRGRARWPARGRSLSAGASPPP